jgi:hypothetical protein
MIPNIPDNIYKVLFAIGVFMIGYSYLEITRNQDTDKFNSRLFDSLKDSLQTIEDSRNGQADFIKSHSEELSERYQVKNPVISIGAKLRFTPDYSTRRDAIVSKAVQADFDKLSILDIKLNLADKRINKRLVLINEDFKDSSNKRGLWYVGAEIGFFALLFGATGMFRLHNLQTKLLENQLGVGEKFIFCQSCAKRFNAAVQHSKYADGEINNYYCTWCFADGDFTNPDIQMHDIVLEYCSSTQKDSRRQIKAATRMIAGLQRWRSGKY